MKKQAKVFIQSLKVKGLAPGTIEETQRRLDQFLDHLATLNIKHVEDITTDEIYSYQIKIHQYKNQFGRTNSAAYQNLLMSTVKQFTKYLWQENDIITDPACNIEYVKEPKKLPRSVLTAKEAKKIVHAPDTSTDIGYRDRTILEVLYSTGIRKAELINIKTSDIDYHDGLLRVTGKGSKDRVVPVGKIACRYLENYIKAVRPKLVGELSKDYLFLSLRRQKFSKDSIWRIVKKYAKKSNMKKNVHPHTFRHTCATGMLKNKASLKSIQELLGHESIESTQIYTRLTITDLKAIHKKCHPREKDKK